MKGKDNLASLITLSPGDTSVSSHWSTWPYRSIRQDSDARASACQPTQLALAQFDSRVLAYKYGNIRAVASMKHSVKLVREEPMAWTRRYLITSEDPPASQHYNSLPLPGNSPICHIWIFEPLHSLLNTKDINALLEMKLMRQRK